MAAGQGFKTFTTGEVLTAADVNGYLMQGVLVFASEAARDAAITSPQEGQFAYTKDNNSLWYYTGSAWAASGATGDIEGVTAGVGISGGGTSGTVTITNSMATAIDAKGDLVAGTGADAFSRLAVGANDTVLTADSTTATGLKWATPASGGMTLLSTTTLSGSTTTVSSISQSYNQLIIQVFDAYSSSPGGFKVRFNSDSTTNYQCYFAEPAGNTLYPTATPWYYDISSSYSITTGSMLQFDTNFFGQLWIYNYADAGTRKTIDAISAFTNAGSNNTTNVNHGFWNNATSGITDITFYAPGGTWTAGTVKIWGLK